MKTIALAALAALSVSGAASAQQMMDHAHMHDMAAAPAAPDTRELLKLSPEAIDALRIDMQHMTAALAKVMEQLAANKRADAAKTLEEGLGVTAMTTHPGMMKASQEMPESARMLGMGTHKAASELAAGLKTAKPAAIYSGLQRIVAGCSSCHATYRVR